MKKIVFTCDVCGCDISDIEYVRIADHMKLDLCCGCSSDLARYVQASQKFGEDIMHYLRVKFPGLYNGEAEVNGADLVATLTDRMRDM